MRPQNQMSLATPRPSETWCLRVCSLDQTLVQTAGDHNPPAPLRPAPRRTDVRIGSLADIGEGYQGCLLLPPRSGHAHRRHQCLLCAMSRSHDANCCLNDRSSYERDSDRGARLRLTDLHGLTPATTNSPHDLPCERRTSRRLLAVAHPTHAQTSNRGAASSS